MQPYPGGESTDAKQGSFSRWALWLGRWTVLAVIGTQTGVGRRYLRLEYFEMGIYTSCQGKPGVYLVVISDRASETTKYCTSTITTAATTTSRSIRGIDSFVHWASLVSRNSNADPLFHLAIDASLRSRPGQRGPAMAPVSVQSPTNLIVEWQ